MSLGAEIALQEFRKRHESYSPVYGNSISEDGQEWKIQRLIDGDSRYQCQRCGKFFCEKQLLQFEDELVCFWCWELK